MPVSTDGLCRLDNSDHDRERWYYLLRYHL